MGLDSMEKYDILKCKENSEAGQHFSLPVFDCSGLKMAELICVDKYLASSGEIVSLLTQWRANAQENFFTQFHVTEERTASWLKEIVIPSKDRILFLIRLESGEWVGNYGVCNMGDHGGELDNAIRGRLGGAADLMFYCEISLLSWLFGVLNYHDVWLHVFSNNVPAILLHRMTGFSVLDRMALVKYCVDGNVTYSAHVMRTDGVIYEKFDYMKMAMTRDFFYENHPWVLR